MEEIVKTKDVKTVINEQSTQNKNKTNTITFPYVTKKEENIALDDSRYLGEPGRPDIERKEFPTLNAENLNNVKWKDSGVMNMSEKKYADSAIEYFKDGVTQDKAQMQKNIFSKTAHGVRAGVFKDISDRLNDIQPLSVYRYEAAKEKKKLRDLGYTPTDNRKLKPTVKDLGSKVAKAITNDSLIDNLG